MISATLFNGKTLPQAVSLIDLSSLDKFEQITTSTVNKSNLLESSAFDHYTSITNSESYCKHEELYKRLDLKLREPVVQSTDDFLYHDINNLKD